MNATRKIRELTELEKLVKKHNIKIQSMPGEPKNDPKWECDSWICRLEFNGRVVVAKYYTGTGLRKTPYGGGMPVPVPPKAADVIYFLIADAHIGDMSFEDFCSGLGHDLDSRSAYKSWQECVEIAPKMDYFLGDLFDEFGCAEH